jgi:hypothetical protein
MGLHRNHYLTRDWLCLVPWLCLGTPLVRLCRRSREAEPLGGIPTQSIGTSKRRDPMGTGGLVSGGYPLCKNKITRPDIERYPMQAQDLFPQVQKLPMAERLALLNFWVQLFQ